jgi:hypothetical protein
LEYERIVFGDKIAYAHAKRHTRTQLFKDMLCACFQANYREHTHWRRCPDAKKFVPTIFTFFYFINIQERDEVAQDHSHKFISSAHGRKCGDHAETDEIIHVDNFTATGRILDYGGMPLNM